MFAVPILQGVILMRMAFADERYSLSGKLYLLSGLANTLLILAASDEGEVMNIALSVVLGILNAVALYFEYTSHARVMKDVKYALYVDWTNVWKWTLRCMVVVLAAISGALLFPILALIGVIVGLIGMLIVKIWYMVCLHHTCQALEEYSRSPREEVSDSL